MMTSRYLHPTNVIENPSPISPRGVMMMSAFQDRMDMVKIPLPLAPSTREEPKDSKKPEGSTPYHGRFSIRPSEEVIGPVLRAVMPLDCHRAETFNRIWQDMIDDVLVKQLGLQKSGHVYAGYFRGRRVVLARTEDLKDHYCLACEEEDIAKWFVDLLGMVELNVEELGMFD